ncbi:MAG TPA: hypothetical protein VFI69_06790 [Candidatus Limnocylindrales bacterium]|nr:hypothetical protein [Candidatus Limnocylindrales bacterium]
MSRAIALVLAAALVLTGCEALAGALPNAPPEPQPCARIYNAAQCTAITDAAALQLGTTREDVVSVEVVPDPTPEVRDGVTVLQTLGGAPRMNLLVTLAAGTVHQVSMCGGVSMEPQCVADPHLIADSVTQGGYHDVPEGSSPVPSAAADALTEATGLHIDRLDIPIGHTGRTEVVLGMARLPNGLLTTADFELVDAWPADLSIVDGRVTLEVRSTEDGKPIQNIYAHGWRTGTESVEAVLVFEVFWFEPGATLSIRDVVVR